MDFARHPDAGGDARAFALEAKARPTLYRGVDQPGWLYMLVPRLPEISDWIKIGRSESLTARHKSLSRGCPGGLELKFARFVRCGASAEFRAHTLLADRRPFPSEWFNLDIADAIAIVAPHLEDLILPADDIG